MTDKNTIPDSALENVSGGMRTEKHELKIAGAGGMIPGVGEKCTAPGCEGTFVFDERCRAVICNMCGRRYDSR